MRDPFDLKIGNKEKPRQRIEEERARDDAGDRHIDTSINHCGSIASTLSILSLRIAERFAYLHKTKHFFDYNRLWMIDDRTRKETSEMKRRKTTRKKINQIHDGKLNDEE